MKKILVIHPNRIRLFMKEQMRLKDLCYEN